MHAESSIIESIRTFFLTCPFLHDGRVNVDYLGEEMSYSIDPLPCDPVIQKYVDGGKKKQYQFAVCASDYGPAGTNVAWDGKAWDALGGLFVIDAITNAEIDAICV